MKYLESGPRLKLLLLFKKVKAHGYQLLLHCTGHYYLLYLNRETAHLESEPARSIIIFSTVYLVVPYGFVQPPAAGGK